MDRTEAAYVKLTAALALEKNQGRAQAVAEARAEAAAAEAAEVRELIADARPLLQFDREAG